MAKETKKTFLTEAEAIEALHKFIKDAQDEDTISISEVRSLLGKTLRGGVVTLENLKIACLEKIKEHARRNQGRGIMEASLWRDLCTEHTIPLEAVEEALDALIIDEAVIENEGQVTTYLPANMEECELKT